MRRLPPAISSHTAATAAGRSLMDAAALTLARSALPTWSECTWVISTASVAETSRPRAPQEFLIAAQCLGRPLLASVKEEPSRTR
jgi:hypothetical protein